MELTGDSFRQLRDALLSAFNENSLRSMVRIELDQNLDNIVGPGALQARVGELINWAERNDRVDDLLAGAQSAVPTNRELQAVELTFKPVSEEKPALEPDPARADLTQMEDESESRQITTLCRRLLGGRSGIIGLFFTLLALVVVAIGFSSDAAFVIGKSTCWARSVFAICATLIVVAVSICALVSNQFRKRQVLIFLLLCLVLVVFLWYGVLTCADCFDYGVTIKDTRDNHEVAGAEVQIILEDTFRPKDTTDNHGYAQFCIDVRYNGRQKTHVVRKAGYPLYEEDLRLTDDAGISQILIKTEVP